MKYFFATLLVLSSLNAIQAQPIRQISGVIKDVKTVPLSGATVSLLKATGSASTQQKLTDNKGAFTFTGLQNDTFIITITAVGFTKYISAKIIISDSVNNIGLPTIIMAPATNENLQGVLVKTRRPLLQQDIDKTIVNVDAMISSAGSSTLQVLEKTPGVTVSDNGDISLNGKAGVLVLIDGRSTYMPAADLANYLRSLPASIVDKLELMDNPSAKYDAAGSAIINIRLKKNKLKGFVGNISTGYSQGMYARNTVGTSISYNHKKINVFSNIGINKEKNYTHDLYDRKFYNAAATQVSSVLLNNNQQYQSNSIDGRIGMDYTASEKTTLGIILSFNRNKRQGSLNYKSDSYTFNKLDSIGNGNITGKDIRTNEGINVNLLHKFNNNGNELSADVNYLRYQSNANQALQNFMYLPNGGLNSNTAFLYNLPAAIKIYTAKADYVHPLKYKASWEAGIKSSIVTNDNDSKYFIAAGNAPVEDNSKSNHFIYHENINAAYINARKSFGRIALQLGVRAENTNISGDLLSNTTIEKNSFSKNYTGVFPTAFASYKLDSAGNNTLTATFARRINRPNYLLLNPFLLYRDNYSYSAGNPMLNPQYQYRTELKYQRKQWLGISLQYNRFTDVIFTTTQAVGNIYISQPNNVSHGYIFIFANNINVSPAKWWMVNANTMLAHMALKGMAYTEKFAPSVNAVRINVLNQFSFSKGFSAELSAFYSGKDIQGQSIINPRYRVAAAAQKKVLKDKGTIRITLEDIFHSWVQKENSVSIQQSMAYHLNESDTQRAGIAFTWRFGKDNSNSKRKNRNNEAEEKGRIDNN